MLDAGKFLVNTFAAARGLAVRLGGGCEPLNRKCRLRSKLALSECRHETAERGGPDG
jgi:hypothetical protein